jgi:hypothetical protein
VVATVNAQGTIDHVSQSIEISGTFSCNFEGTSAGIDLTSELHQQQKSGEVVLFNEGGIAPICSPPGATLTWTVFYPIFRFRPGPAVLLLSIKVCDPEFIICAFNDFHRHKVLLVPGTVDPPS